MHTGKQVGNYRNTGPGIRRCALLRQVKKKANACMLYLDFILFGGGPAALVAFAVWLDNRTRRGYGLGFLAIITLVLEVWATIVTAQAIQQSNAQHLDNFTEGLGIAILELYGLYLTLVLVLGSIVEALMAQQRLWAAIIAVLSFVPAVVVLAPGTALVPDILARLGFPRGLEIFIVLFLPLLVTLLYALLRTIKPVTPSGS